MSMGEIGGAEQQHQDEDGNGSWNFKHIFGHEGPFRASDPEYKGSRYNILIDWENGETTSEPLNIFGKDEQQGKFYSNTQKFFIKATKTNHIISSTIPTITDIHSKVVRLTSHDRWSIYG
jgi:hypothetical protein